jgi:hypothetical protein
MPTAQALLRNDDKQHRLRAARQQAGHLSPYLLL